MPKLVVTSFKLPEDLLNVITNLANSMGKSRSEVVREVLYIYLEYLNRKGLNKKELRVKKVVLW
jgi:metal-responsive CopG/Arc/MetJ family transcriptional regulator